ncbi:MAG: response regulator [Burkholderiales bacterium]|nr:response regulator [Burkholderiales bacterium]MDR4518418.1 response regulator [Nitrosomonas sp.]
MFDLPSQSNIIPVTHNIWLVVLSYCVAVLGSYVAFNFTIWRDGFSLSAKRFATGICAFTMGSGIWSMHFTAMLALELPLPVSYDTDLTVLSFVLAVSSAWFSFSYANTQPVSPHKIVIGGLAMGIGIAAMHFTGMAAMHIDGGAYYYKPNLFIASVLIAITISVTALWLKIANNRFKTNQKSKVSIAFFMGIAIFSMHYTGMTATIFVSDNPLTSFESAGSEIGLLVLSILILLFIILLVAHFMAWLQRDFCTQKNTNRRYSFSVSFKMMVYIFLFSILFTFISTFFLMKLEYKQIVEQKQGSLNQIVLSYKNSIENSLWIADYDQIGLLGEGIYALSSVSYIEIEKDGKALFQKGQKIPLDILSRKVPLTFSYRGNTVSLGTLIVAYDHNLIDQQIIEHFKTIILTETLKAIVISLIMLTLFYKIVGQHLINISMYASTLDKEKLSNPLILERPNRRNRNDSDELDTLVESINHMRQRIYASFSEIEGYFGRILDKSSSEIYIFEPSTYQLNIVNLGGRKNLGYEIDDLHTINFLDLLPDSHQKNFIEHTQNLRQDMQIDVDIFETEFKRKDHSRYPVEVRLQFMHSEKPPVFIAVAENISERIEYQNKLIQAKEEAEQASLAKSQFLANMSHEIRTPMHAIIGLNDLLLKQDHSPTARDYLQKIETSSKSLLAIINDILDFSKIEAGKLDFESIVFDLNESLDELVSCTTRQLKGKPVELIINVQPGTPTWLVGDPLRLKQVITNLMSNAIKFTSTGEVLLSIQQIDNQADQVVLQFSVKDTGIGLSEEHINKLFTEFNQADASTTRKFGGTGLGLSICRKLIEGMQGEIWVKSKEKIGSEFCFKAVFGIPKNVLNQPQLLPDHLQGKSILVLDDNPTFLAMMQNCLQQLGINPTLCATSDAALEQIENNQENFDLLCVEWDIKDLPVTDFLEQLRSKSSAQTSPKVIVMVSNGSVLTDDIINNYDIDEILEKPVTQFNLFNTLKAVLKNDVKAIELNTSDSVKLEVDNSLAGSRVLLVDDNEVNLEIGDAILTNAGLVVSRARNGVQAIEILSESDFDCILMDISMPEMDGYEATRIIRGIQRYETIPIIALTANTVKGDYEKARKAGMDDHLGKPFNREQLFAILEKLICNKKLAVNQH